MRYSSEAKNSAGFAMAGALAEYHSLDKKIEIQIKINDGLEAANSEYNFRRELEVNNQLYYIYFFIKQIIKIVFILQARLRDKKELNNRLISKTNELQGKIPVLVVLSDCAFRLPGEIVHVINKFHMIKSTSAD